MKLENVIIPACVRGFTSELDLFDIELRGDRVVHIRPSQYLVDAGANSIPAGPSQKPPLGTLLPCFADVHVHIDKTYVAHEVGAAAGDLPKAITLMAAHRDRWTGAELRSRMQRALLEAHAMGTRAMRTHLDWTTPDAPRALAVFEHQRDAWRGRIALQCVSLTPLDVFADLGLGQQIAAEVAQVHQRCNHAMGEAALLGAYVYRNDQMVDKLRRVFDLAKQFDLSLDFHVDEGLDYDARGLRAIAELTCRYQMEGRVTCGHACSLSIQTQNEVQITLQLCSVAQIHLVALPSTNLYLQGAWDRTPIERGITRLKEAQSLGISTSIATDNVADGFFPYGSYDLLDTFGLGVQVAHLSPADAWLGAITTQPALAMGLPWGGKIAEGCPADLVLLHARSSFELLSAAGRRRGVIRGGKFLKTDP
jgi:cytosine/creatinine deaminase